MYLFSVVVFVFFDVGVLFGVGSGVEGFVCFVVVGCVGVFLLLFG